MALRYESRALTGVGIESRRAVRGLCRSPGFSIGVVLVLGIAIAGLVTVATAAYALFLRPLPFAQPERLAQISVYSRSMGFELGSSPPMLAYLREEPMIVDLAAYLEASSASALNGDTWQNALVTHNLFAVLGVGPLAGRSFTPTDAEPGSLPVALISESAWRTRFGASESAIGSSIVLNGKRLTVIGVMPASFSVPSPATELWQPLRYTSEELSPNRMTSFSGGQLIARLEPGYTAAQLQSALRARYSDDYPWVQEMMGLELRVNGLREAWTTGQRQPLAMIGLASLLVLAAALFNVAGLWLTRLLASSHEQAVQAAMGAGAWRRLGRTVIEFLLLGAAAACLALALTPFTLDWLKGLGTLSFNQPLPVQSGPATVAITLVVLGLGGLPVLMAAAWQQRRQRRELLTALSSGGRGYANSGTRVRRGLIIAQVALAMSLLCAMGLLLKSWHGLLTEDLGFDPQNLLVAKINAPADSDNRVREPDPRVTAALDAVRGIPGVTGLAFTTVAPFGPSESMNTIPMPGQEDRDTTVRTRNVGENYFRTIGIPLLRGRDFAVGDFAKGSIVVDQYFASLYFPEDGAVGERIRVRVGPERLRDAVIIGVAGTAKYRAPDEQAEHGTVYGFMPAPLSKAIAVIATQVPPVTLIDEVKNALETSIGPDRTGSIVAMESLVRDTVRDREPQLILLVLFGTETLALAAIGLFSLLAYSVRARTAEFGIRQAVGANAGNIRRHVLADAVRLLIPGLAIGIAGAWLAGLLVAKRLYEVSPVDPVTWIAIGTVLALVVLAAGFWPAERAARIQPTEALRYE